MAIPLEQLSDQELDNLIMQQQAPQQAPKLEELPDEELDLMINDLQAQRSPDERGLGSKIISGIGEAADVLGAPTRSALMATVRGENPLTAFSGQFLQPSAMAPTGKEIAMQTGISQEPIMKDVDPFALQGGMMGDDMLTVPGGYALKESLKGETVDLPSPAGVVGLGIDVAADPLAFVPFGKILGTGAKIGKGGAKFALKGSARAADLALGTEKLTRAGEIIGKSVDDIKSIMKSTFKPKIAPDFDALKKVAAKNNIDTSILPESIEFGKESFVSRASRQRAELGGKKLEDFKEAVRQTTDAFDNRIKNLSAVGDTLDPVSAGSLIRDSYDRGVQRFFDGMDVTHNKIIASNPGLKVSDAGMAAIESKLAGIEKFAKGRVARGTDTPFVSQGKRLLRNIKNIRNSNGSYKQMVEALREIGEVAFQSKNAQGFIPADTKKMREIYRSINDSLVETVRAGGGGLGDDVADQLVLNNKVMSDFFGDKSVLKRIGDKNLSDEALFKAIITNGDSKKIDALKNIISPEEFSQLKGAFVNDIARVNQDGDLLFRSTYNAMNKKAPIVNEMLKGDEVTDLMEILNFGDRMGTPVLSTSGTGASNVISQIADNIKTVVSNDLLIENLKQAARNKGQIKKIEKLTSAVSKSQARKIIKNAKLPKRVEMEALKKVRSFSFGPRRAGIKAAQVKKVQEQNDDKQRKALKAKGKLDKLIERPREIKTMNI